MKGANGAIASAFTPARQDCCAIAEAAGELGRQPRLADASLAGDRDELRVSRSRSLPRSRESGQFDFAPDERPGPRGENGLWGRPLECHDLGLSEQKFVT